MKLWEIYAWYGGWGAAAVAAVVVSRRKRRQQELCRLDAEEAQREHDYLMARAAAAVERLHVAAHLELLETELAGTDLDALAERLRENDCADDPW